MKYKVLSIFVILVVLCISLIASSENKGLQSRTHQHLEYNEQVLNEQSGDEFITHLPIINLNMDGAEPQIYKLDAEQSDEPLTEEKAMIEVIGGKFIYLATEEKGIVEVLNNNNTANSIADNPSMQILSNIRIRGNSSSMHNKKNYKLGFINEDGSENKTNGLLGMEPHDEWALHGPYLDRTLIRNYVCMNIAGQVLPYTPDVRFCELFINGEYRGIYLAMETVARGEGRVDIAVYDNQRSISSYIYKVDWNSNDIKHIEPFTEYTRILEENREVSLIYPVEGKTSELKNNIVQEISSFEKMLYSYDYDDSTYGYRSFIDVGSFIDYLIINEVFQNYDAGFFSTYFYKDMGDKLHIGPVWDFNNSFDNFLETREDFSIIYSEYYSMLMRDEYFVERLIKRYWQLRESILSEDYVLNYVDETVDYLGPSIERNFEVWDDTFNYDQMQDEIRLQPEWRNSTSYKDAIDDLKESFITRIGFLDQHINTLLQYSHESKVKRFND